MRGQAEHTERWEQTKKWAGSEGVAYTERNPGTVPELNELKRETYGVSQTELHGRYLSALPDTLDVLEVGTNIGSQLETLRRLGYRNLTGVDVCRYAIDEGRRKHPDLELLAASGHRLPFDDGAFDLAFTAGTLITFPPEEIDVVVDELVRVSDRYVYGIEFYADEYVEIGDRGLYWKTDFVDVFRSRHDLRVLEETYLPYRNENVRDVVYLLEKT